MFKNKFYPIVLLLTIASIVLAACSPSAKDVAVELATIQAAQVSTLTASTAVPVSVAPTAAPAAPGLNTEGYTGPTTAEAKVAIGLDIQRLKTEASSFVWRSIPNSVSAICAVDWKCTLHLATGEIKVFVGDGSTYQVVAGTWRYSPTFPEGDAVQENPPCGLLEKEQKFGAQEIPSFPVYAGNFTCSASLPSAATLAPAAPSSAITCPTFGGIQTTPGNDGSAFCKYKGAVVTDKVPAGFKAEYWDGSAVAYASAGEKITTGDATFRRP